MIEDLNAVVLPVSDVKQAFGIQHHSVDEVELFRTGSFLPSGFDEFSILVELHDTRIPVDIGHEDIAAGSEGHVGRLIEMGLVFRGLSFFA